MEFEAAHALYQKDLEDASKKKDWSRLKLLTAKEIVDRIVKGEKDFSNVKIFGVDWARRDLSGFNFSGSKIEWCVFSGCKIKNADFSGAFLDWCIFDNTDLSKSSFKNSIILDEIFIGSNLSDVDFSDSDLRWSLFANNIGRPNFKNCTETKVWYSVEDAFKDKDVLDDLENIDQWLRKAGLPISQALTWKIKIKEMQSSTEKLRLFYNMKQSFNREEGLNLYNLGKAGKPSLGEYKGESAGIYTSKTEYGAKNERKRTDAYSR